DPRIFAGDRVAARQSVGSPRRDVPEIANGGRDNIEAGRKRFGSLGVAHAVLVARLQLETQACWRLPGARSASVCSPFYWLRVRSVLAAVGVGLSSPAPRRSDPAALSCPRIPRDTASRCWRLGLATTP